MPWPISLYQGPLSLPMSMPAAFQSSSSAACVPGPVAARDERRALGLDRLQRRDDVLHALDAGRIALRADQDEVVVHHGIALHARSLRRGISPPAAWRGRTRTSASPRRPVSSAWPVPCATTFTSIPVLALNSGRIWPNRPESCVEVVEATTIDLSCACTGEAGEHGDGRGENQQAAGRHHGCPSCFCVRR